MKIHHAGQDDRLDSVAFGLGSAAAWFRAHVKACVCADGVRGKLEIDCIAVVDGKGGCNSGRGREG